LLSFNLVTWDRLAHPNHPVILGRSPTTFMGMLFGVKSPKDRSKKPAGVVRKAAGRIPAVTRAVRTILAEWARRVWWGVAGLVWIVCAVLFLLFLLLGLFHSWGWFIPLALVVVATFSLTIVLMVARGAIGLVGKTKYRGYKECVNRIVDKVTMLADVKGTPAPLLGLRIVFDLAFNRTEYLLNLLDASTTVKDDFAELLQLMGQVDLRTKSDPT
jgi:hypothetical protein